MPQMTGYPVDTSVTKRAVPQTVRLDALRQVGLFKGVSKRSLLRIDQLSEVRSAFPGDVLVTQGDPGNELMVVLEGRASVTRGTRS